MKLQKIFEQNTDHITLNENFVLTDEEKKSVKSAIANNQNMKVLSLINLNNEMITVIAEGLKGNKKLDCICFDSIDPSSLITSLSKNVLIVELKNISQNCITQLINGLKAKNHIKRVVISDMDPAVLKIFLDQLKTCINIDTLIIKSNNQSVQKHVVEFLLTVAKPYTLLFNDPVTQEQIETMLSQLSATKSIKFNGTTPRIINIVNSFFNKTSANPAKQKRKETTENRSAQEERPSKQQKIDQENITKKTHTGTTQKNVVEEKNPTKAKSKSKNKSPSNEKSTKEGKSAKKAKINPHQQIEKLEQRIKELEDEKHRNMIENIINSTIDSETCEALRSENALLKQQNYQLQNFILLLSKKFDEDPNEAFLIKNSSTGSISAKKVSSNTSAPQSQISIKPTAVFGPTPPGLPVPQITQAKTFAPSKPGLPSPSPLSPTAQKIPTTTNTNLQQQANQQVTAKPTSVFPNQSLSPQVIEAAQRAKIEEIKKLELKKQELLLQQKAAQLKSTLTQSLNSQTITQGTTPQTTAPKPIPTTPMAPTKQSMPQMANTPAQKTTTSTQTITLNTPTTTYKMTSPPRPTSTAPMTSPQQPMAQMTPNISIQKLPTPTQPIASKNSVSTPNQSSTPIRPVPTTPLSTTQQSIPQTTPSIKATPAFFKPSSPAITNSTQATTTQQMQVLKPTGMKITVNQSAPAPNPPATNVGNVNTENNTNEKEFLWSQGDVNRVLSLMGPRK